MAGPWPRPYTGMGVDGDGSCGHRGKVMGGGEEDEVPDVRAKVGEWSIGLLAACLIMTACGGDAEDPDSVTFDQGTGIGPQTGSSVGPADTTSAPFVNAPMLAIFISRNALAIPARFVDVDRTDFEPILTLGSVDAAARSTYSSPTTNEVLLLDLLHLAAGVDAAAFFAAFADALVDNTDFRGARKIGVPRGVGDRARHYVFTVQGDHGEVAAIIRNDLVALIKYRRPAGVRSPIDVAALLRQIDTIVQVGPAESAGES